MPPGAPELDIPLATAAGATILQHPSQRFPDPIPGLIPFNTITIFAGATGAGKTTMAVPWISAWLDGGTICGYPTNKPAEVVWITADRPGEETLEWFERQGIDTNRLKIYSVLDDPQFPIHKLKTPGTVAEAFEYCLKKTSPAPGALVIFDPLTPLFVMGDTNKARDVALTLFHYARLCLALRITLICMGHFSKQKGGKDDRYARPQDRIAGSNAFGGFSSTQIYLLDPEPGDSQIWTLGWVPRHNAACQFSFIRSTEGFFVELPDESVAPETAESRKLGRSLLLSLLPPTPETISFSIVLSQLQEKFHVKQSPAYRYRDQLLQEGLICVPSRGRIARTAKVADS